MDEMMTKTETAAAVEEKQAEAARTATSTISANGYAIKPLSFFFPLTLPIFSI